MPYYESRQDTGLGQALRQEYEARGFLVASFRVPKKFRRGAGIINETIRHARDEIRRDMLDRVREQFKRKRLIATGDLYRSLRVRNLREVETGAGWYVLGVVASGAPAQYLPFVEAGMPPGRRINPSSLTRWMQARGIPLFVAGRIASRLQQRGYRGRHPMRDARAGLDTRLRRNLERVVRDAGEEWLLAHPKKWRWYSESGGGASEAPGVADKWEAARRALRGP